MGWCNCGWTFGTAQFYRDGMGSGDDKKIFDVAAEYCNHCSNMFKCRYKNPRVSNVRILSENASERV